MAVLKPPQKITPMIMKNKAAPSVVPSKILRENKPGFGFGLTIFNTRLSELVY
jgi:hypothetical protein